MSYLKFRNRSTGDRKIAVGVILIAVGVFLIPFQVSAGLLNAGFENGFNDWTATGDPYMVTDNGSGRTRDSYLNYAGWAGADVWFSGLPKEGSKYAVFGSQGNESVGTLTSSLWTAENQYLSFWHAGNNSSGIAESSRAYAAILDASGNELSRVYATSYNDSQWREFNIDLEAAGLSAGDQFRFHYVDGYSWSIIDNISESGPLLASAEIPEPPSVALMALALMGIGAFTRKRHTSI